MGAGTLYLAKANMPKLPDIELAKTSLERELRDLCSKKSYSAALIPSLRELSERHGMSKSLAQRVVRGLCNEGLLFPVHGMGTFAGRRPILSERVFLFVNEGGPQNEAIREGFEERLSALGAQSISVHRQEVTRLWRSGQLPEVEGIWINNFEEDDSEQSQGPRIWAPTVGVLGHVNPEKADSVFFDDFQGGKDATQHLLAYGVRKAIFLGVHPPTAPYNILGWSERRAEGFTAAMKSVGLDSKAKILLPSQLIMRESSEDPYDYFRMGALLAKGIKDFDSLVGIVAANDRVAYGFLSAILQSGINATEIPPMISFDNSDSKVGNFLSSMVLPWSEVGRVAADIIFRRATGSLSEGPISEMVGMIPITRPSSSRGWLSKSPSFAAALTVGHSESDFFR